jgi:hypothetical protein
MPIGDHHKQKRRQGKNQPHEDEDHDGVGLRTVVLHVSACPRLLPDFGAVLTIEHQHPLIALDNAAACILAADLSAADDAEEPGAEEGGCHAPLPQATPGTALDLLHVADARVPKAVLRQVRSGTR